MLGFDRMRFTSIFGMSETVAIVTQPIDSIFLRTARENVCTNLAAYNHIGEHIT